MNQDEHKIVVRRMAGLIAAASVLIAVYVLRLIFLQLVNSDSFKAQATNTTDYNFTVTAARGDIEASTGRRIAARTTSYKEVLSKLLMGDEDLDAMLQRIVELLEAHGEKWYDSLRIGEPDAAGHYSFTAQADSTSDQKALAAMKDSLGLQQYATADDVMEKLVEDYKLENYSLHWQRVLGGIHYEMQQQAFSNVNNFVMAENVSETTVATIKENSLTLPGVEIVETSTRSYDEGYFIPHVLGRVGKITAEKWKVTDENGQTTYPLREKGYNMNDMIGVSGLEAVYEDELRGKDGAETITRSSDGVIVGTAMTTVPEPGHTVQHTIARAFQQAVDTALAKNNEKINRTIEKTQRQVLEEAGARGKEVKFLVQGTLYPDVVESGGGDGAANIKSHHNVGGLPDDIKFQLVEPLRTLFKDEVRAIGTELGLPDEIVWRQPFPGPGLGIRIIGEITKERLDLLREADAIARDEQSKAGLDRDIKQSPHVHQAAVQNVGVQGDERTYGSPIVLRPVSSEDAMTADWSRIPYDVLATISTRITNECRQINRVVLDCTSKPPATIEWE